MNEEIEELLSIISEGQNSIQLQEIKKYITNLQEENEKLNKIIDELEKWLKETKKFNYGFKIKSEYIYVHEFVCKNILNKLTELKKEV